MARTKRRDDQWGRIEDLVPGKEGDRGRSGANNRLFVEAVLRIIRTGAPWRDLPSEFGNWNSVFQRFNRWAKSGAWEKIFTALADDPDFEYLKIDSIIVRARQHSAGGKKAGHAEEALGRSKGGMTTKIHTAVDALGNPVRFILTQRQASDYKQGAALIEGFPAQNVLGDKGYDGDDVVETI